MTKTLNIGVTGINSADNPAPGLSVMRCIKEAPGWTGKGVGFGYDVLDAGFHKRGIFDCSYLFPYPSDGAESLLKRIAGIHGKVPLDVIIPSLDTEMLNFVIIEDDLRKLGIKIFLPTRDQLRLCSKTGFAEFAGEKDIPIPKTYILNNINRLGMAVEHLGFPMMVKGPFYEAYVARSIDETGRYVHKINSKWGMPIILQKFIQGDEYNVAAIGDGKGGYVGCVCMKKLLVTEQGKGWAGISIAPKGLLGLTEKFFSATNWQGPLELEIIQDRRSDEKYVLEVNSRFPAWIYLAKAAGINLPWMAVRMAVGEKVKHARKYKSGIIYSRCSEDLITDINSLDRLGVTGETYYE